MTKIICISDTHNQHEKLTENLLKIHKEFNDSILIHVGDACNKNTNEEAISFLKWFSSLPFSHKIFVPGNHDPFSYDFIKEINDDSFKNLLIPINKRFNINNIDFLANSHIPSFRNLGLFSTEYTREEFFNNINKPVDIILSHVPPYGFGDTINPHCLITKEHVGCKILKKYIEKTKPKYVINGHIHEGFGLTILNTTKIYNCSILLRNKITTIDFKR